MMRLGRPAPVSREEQAANRPSSAQPTPQLVHFLCAGALESAHVFFLATDRFQRHDRVVTLKMTNSGILTEKLKADDSVDALTARLNFKF